MQRHSLRYRAAVASRALAAIVGGYVLTSSAVAAIAVYLPLASADATLTATLLSFAIYAGIVLWVFATQSAMRVWLIMAAAAVTLKALLWISDAPGLL